MFHSGSFLNSVLSSIAQLCFVLLLLVVLSHTKSQANLKNEDSSGTESLSEDEELHLRLIRKEAWDIFGLNFTVPPEKFPRGWLKEFSNYTPPPEYRKAFSTYLSGFDYDDQPIWVAEWGKYDFRGFLHDNVTRNLEGYEKYSRWCFFVMVLSTGIKSTEDHPIDQFTAILDFAGFRLDRGLMSAKIARWIVDVSVKVRPFVEDFFAYAIAVNVNPVAEIFTSFVRSVLGRVSDRFEVLGTDKNKWLPKLLKKFPRDQLPREFTGLPQAGPLVNIG